MRQKLTLLIAFFVFAATTAFGVSIAFASPDPAGSVNSDVSAGATGATGPTAPAEPDPPATPQPPVPPPTDPEPQPRDVTRNDAIKTPVVGEPTKTKGSSGDRGSQAVSEAKRPKPQKQRKKKTGGKDAEEVAGEEDEELDEADIFGPAPIAVPNVVLDSFEIPPFLLPIYQACGTQYAIPWQLLAAINKIETAFGTNLSTSYAGAMGWMQFMPGTWASYGVDANGDGRKDPYNPVDAICAAARYLRAAGGTERLREAIFAYNHANWYVNDVLELTRRYSQLPEHLISSLSGLTEGAHFPVASNARYADQVTVREAIRKAETRGQGNGNIAEVLSSTPGRRSVTIFARPGAPVVAVNDGEIKSIGKSRRLGTHVVLEDVYGNRYTYAGLSSVQTSHPVRKRAELSDADFEMVTPDGDKMPTQAASKTRTRADRKTSRMAEEIARRSAREGHAGHDHGADDKPHDPAAQVAREPSDARAADPVNTEDLRPRLYARPHRPNIVERAALTGQLDHPIAGGKEFEAFKASPGAMLRVDSRHYEMRPLRKGSTVIAGTLLGRASNGGDTESGTVQFSIRPAGEGAPAIDPKPILDGWRLLNASAIYRAKRKNPFFTGTGVGQVLMLPKPSLIRRVLNDPRIEIYSCGREDIAGGSVDRRVLSLLAYLAERGFSLTVTSLTCGHGYYTTSGNVSNHSHGRAVDIAAINGQPILGNQGPGSLTEAVLKAILRLQGTMVPSELISLHELGGPSFAMGDHADHIHVGYRAQSDPGSSVARAPEQILKPGQWTRLMQQLGRIENPDIPGDSTELTSPAEAGD